MAQWLEKDWPHTSAVMCRGVNVVGGVGGGGGGLLLFF